MNPKTVIRVLRDTLFSRSLRQTYWDGRVLIAEVGRLLKADNRHFRRHVVRDMARFVFNRVRPVPAETEQRARAAVDWILHAQQATADEGVSLGYFPCSPDAQDWKPSYPETTGYIITSLLAFADQFQDDAVRDAALRMAHWEIGVQMDSGAVQGGPVCAPAQQTPAAFNTGMVLDGWCSAYLVTRAPELLAAARRAADFLLGDLDPQGYFRTNGAFVSSGEIKTYTCLCAWAIYRFGEISAEPRYCQAAVRCIEAALRQQQGNGWFAHNCLTRSAAPLTHTLGYTLQGVLEVGLLAGRADFIAAVHLCVKQIIPHISKQGYLPARFYADWEPAQFSSCLTGSAQIAIVCYRLGEVSPEYLHSADRVVNYLKDLQRLATPLPAINGAIAGSFPMFGSYMRAGYPNWATKYFLDALLLQARNRVLS